MHRLRRHWRYVLTKYRCTGFAAVIILVRVCARKIRAGRIFNEEKLMLISLVSAGSSSRIGDSSDNHQIPLFIRMGLVHAILLFGTNNVDPSGLTAEEIHLRSIGSKLVLASRISFAAFIWVSKLTVSEFLKGIAKASWTNRYQRGLDFIRIFLLATFIAVVIATLAACQPFDHYWQVVPTASAQCRLGYAQLITMGACDIITDMLLVAYPIPIIVRSRMPLKRKICLIGLFSLSICLIAITATRVPEVIAKNGRQQYRTVWASCEILASAAVANAVVLGSFVRDRGIKRNRFKRGSTVDSAERTIATHRSTLKPTMDSDEDLFHALGCRVPTQLQNTESPIARPAPVAFVHSDDYFMSGGKASPSTPMSPMSPLSPTTLEPATTEAHRQPSPHDSADALPKTEPPTYTHSTSPKRSPRTRMPPRTVSSVTFWDVGGLLETGGPSVSLSGSGSASPSPAASTGPPSPNTGLRGPGVAALDFAPLRPPSHGLFNRLSSRSRSPRWSSQRAGSRGSGVEVGEPMRMATPSSSRTPPATTTPTRTARSGTVMSLQDVGGLLG